MYCANIKLVGGLPDVDFDFFDLSRIVNSRNPITRDSKEVQDFLEEHYETYISEISLEEYKNLIEIEIEKIPCEGCECCSLQQDHHMECPSGCLHDPDTCSMCQF
jgi:hypothetical protein